MKTIVKNIVGLGSPIVKALGLSQPQVKILTGVSAGKAIIRERLEIIHFFLNFFGMMFINVKELAELYFYLPEERRYELIPHLNKLAGDFASWKSFHYLNKRGDEIVKRMAVSEMMNCAVNFSQAFLAWESAGPEDKEKVLALMEKLAISFNDKIRLLLATRKIISPAEAEKLLSEADDFSKVEQLLFLSLPVAVYSRAVQKLFSFADSFDRMMRTHRRSLPGSPLRREIVAATKEHETDYKSLLLAYRSEKHWTAMKRMLFNKVNRLVLGIEDWIEILLSNGNDKKLKGLIMGKLSCIGLSFRALDNSLNGVTDHELRALILNEMFSFSAGFKQFKTICVKTADDRDCADIFRKAFQKLVAVVANKEEGREACDLLNKNKNKNQARRLLGKIASFGDSDFEVLMKFHGNADRETRRVLLPMLRTSAAGDFDKTERIICSTSSARYIHLCLRDMLAIATASKHPWQLAAVYARALAPASNRSSALLKRNGKIAVEAAEKFKIMDLNFSVLAEIQGYLEKAGANNNGLADFIQQEMIRKAGNEGQRSLAFSKASIENKAAAIRRLMAA